MSNDKVAATFHPDMNRSEHDIFRERFALLGTEIFDIAQSKGWYDEPRTFGDRIALMHSELSEALEEHRDGHAPTEIYYSHEDGCRSSVELRPGVDTCDCVPKPEGIPVELADAVIRIMDYCAAEGIDLLSTMYEKMRYNISRTHRHGGKKL